VRQINNKESFGAPRANPDCPWCRGKNYVSVVDIKLIEKMGSIDSISKEGVVSFIPRTSVACPDCHPDGIRLNEKKITLTLWDYVNKAYDCFPVEYWQLLGTVLYLDLRIRMSSEDAIDMVKQQMKWFREESLLPAFLNASTTQKEIKYTPKSIPKRSYREKEEKRMRDREALQRMMGERD
jgi:hypothetical protein